MEDVHDDIDKIQEHPTTLLNPFHVQHRRPSLFHTLDNPLGDTSHVRIRRSARNHEVVGDIGHPVQIEHHDIVSLEFMTERGGVPGEYFVSIKRQPTSSALWNQF